MDIQIINDIDEREFTKILLTDKKKYALCTDKLKKKHFFMTQRALAKGYPIQVNKLSNHNGINEVAILDAYHNKLCKDGGMQPKFLFTSGNKNAGKGKESKLFDTIKGDKIVCDTLLKFFDIELKSLEDLIKLDYNYVDQEYNRLMMMFAGKLKRNQKMK